MKWCEIGFYISGKFVWSQCLRDAIDGECGKSLVVYGLGWGTHQYVNHNVKPCSIFFGPMYGFNLSSNNTSSIIYMLLLSLI